MFTQIKNESNQQSPPRGAHQLTAKGGIGGISGRTDNQESFDDDLDNYDENEELQNQGVSSEIKVMELLISSVAKGTSKSVIEIKFVQEELLRAAKTGDLKKINKIVEHGLI